MRDLNDTEKPPPAAEDMELCRALLCAALHVAVRMQANFETTDHVLDALRGLYGTTPVGDLEEPET